MAERHKIIPASYLVLFKENKVMLLRRQNSGYCDGMYSLIAGHVDEGETFTQAIIRETKEEAGIELQTENLELVHMMHRKSHVNNEERIDAFFITRSWEGKITNMEPHKCDDLSWFDLDNLPKNIILYIKEVLVHIKNNKYYSENGWDINNT
ncbi:NUDIX domain-containing protein [archaeon]|jgi:8-oxo-dGTP diphosphatase|nr:NUDIX domain-containing protein [archaeon]MBT3451316.1 NUDIX domain-containing protein [archaeon]MBT6869368.1 NUDIX domain-containing protein [archaeon]MBT7192531.1 NUDIX domain-containing protein [archaeon]MBT7380607.1 NUDIX domain-containing protein [archaeon]